MSIWILNLLLVSYRGWWRIWNLRHSAGQLATVAKCYTYIDAVFFLSFTLTFMWNHYSNGYLFNKNRITGNTRLFFVKLIWCQMNCSLTRFSPQKIDHICGWRRRKMRHYPLMWVSLRHTSIYPDQFTKITKKHVGIVCFRRSYCRHYCRLWWLAMALSTLPESSKIWMPHQNWKPSRFICTSDFLGKV